MFTIKNYVRAQSLEEAYALNQKRSNVVLGGLLWLKMGKKNITTAIDLCDLGLGGIEETEDAFLIGCRATLRELELHPGLHTAFDGVVRESVRHIVGVQFRNLATVGGSVYSRFGFSDILTCFLALGAQVETYPGGVMSLRSYIASPRGNEILTRVILKKDGRKARYLSLRKSATNLPVLTCAVAKIEDRFKIVLGARPMKAMVVSNTLSAHPSAGELEAFSEDISKWPIFGDNMRASAAYRAHLAGVLACRAIEAIERRPAP